jgi:hypothetical protein
MRDDDVTLAIAGGVYVAVISVGVALLLWFAWRIAAYFLRLFFRYGMAGSDEPIIRIAAFAGAALLFPDVLLYAFRTGARLISELLRAVPNSILASASSIGPRCREITQECMNSFAQGLSVVWADLVKRIFDVADLSRAPVVDAVLMCAVWAVTGFVLHHAKAVTVGASGGASGLGAQFRQLWHGVPVPVRQNVQLLALLLVAGYLSITAIIAIPITEKPAVRQTATAAPIATAKDLRERFSRIAMTREQFDRDFPLTLPFTKPLPPSDAPYPANLAPYVKTLDSAFTQLLNQSWVNLRARHFGRQAELIDQASVTFELSNADRLGDRERIQHLLDIDNWYQNWWLQARNQLNACRSALVAAASALDNLYNFFPSSRPEEKDARDVVRVVPMIDEIGKANNLASRHCNESLAEAPMPRRAELGSSLGIFGAATKWLLRTESLPLVLIVGLVGFGLFGAACSSFVRQREKAATPGGPWVEDLIGVIIRGSSAAVVVFLAVFGGLAVFAGPSAEPNPYVVLFACFVGAVYSQDAWTWARRRFGTAISASPGRDRGAGKGNRPS